MSSLHIRAATPDDSALVLSLVHALAEYEKLAHEVSATEAELHSYLFGEKPAAEVIIAEWEGAPAGFALFFQNFSTFVGKPGLYLEDLFVKPELRGNGIGKALLVRLAQIARERDYGRMEWAVLDWNAPSIAFYKSLGAVPMDDWTVFRLQGDAVDRLADTS